MQIIAVPQRFLAAAVGKEIAQATRGGQKADPLRPATGSSRKIQKSKDPYVEITNDRRRR
jgi:hypothetical protein